jgi:preprotein translocase subunit SecY
MLETLRNAFRIKDIRNRLIFTFLMLIVIRIGSTLPIPGIDSSIFASWFASQTADGMGFFDAITGGSFYKMSVFALSITPYITSSIIMQLLTIAIPKLEEMQRDGEEGRKKIAEITRYLTVALALIESIAMVIGFKRGGYLENNEGAMGVISIIMIVLALTAGSAVLMWIGEQITEKGVGNGISIVLIINIISRMPDDIGTLYDQFVSGKTIPKAILASVIILAIIIAMVVLVVLLQGGERRIPVQYSKKIQGRKQVGGQSTHIPLKVNTGGVIPVIFAQSLLQTPVIIASLLGKGNGTGIGSKILRGMSQSNWCDPNEPIYSIGLVVYIVLIIAFAYFYTSITFNPLEIANNMKKSGGFIPGIRPGKPTSDYLNQILNYIVFIGAVALAFIAFVPIFFNGVFGANVSFGGTSIIIIVGVVIETLKQIESQMRVRYYKGFLND